MRIFSLVILLFLAACQSTSTGIGSKGPVKSGAQTNFNSGSQTSSANTSQEQGIEVIEISVTDALKLAGDTIFEKFPQLRNFNFSEFSQHSVITVVPNSNILFC